MEPKQSSLRRWAPDILRSVALAILVSLLWCATYNRWTSSAWQVPVAYIEDPSKSDVLSFFAGIKAARDGRTHLLASKIIPELGAPFQAQWNDFPTVEEFVGVFPGFFAKFIGIFAAANLTLLLAHVLAGLSMYAACRLLRVHWIWAFAFGMVYALATFAWAQALHHITVTYYWHVPLGLVVARWLFVGDGIVWRTPRFWFGVAVAFVTGVNNVYYTFIFLQFVGFAGLYQWIRRGWRAAVPAVLIGTAAVSAFVLMNVDTFVFHLLNGPNKGAVVRNYQWMELYALKVVDLAIPFPDHRLFSGFAQGYFKNVLLLGEVPPGSYLGLIGIGALVLLAIVTFTRLVKGNKIPVPLEAAQTIWIVLFATVAGLNCFLGVFGFQLFRTGSRYSVVILALVLLFLARRLSALLKNDPGVAVAIAAILIGIAFWDQTPPFTSDAQVQQIQRQLDSDRSFTEQMESKLPPGAMVFQLPMVRFPESPVPGVSGYDHFRPYFFSSKLRYQFGSVKGRPRDEWTADLAGGSLKDAVDAFERYGFSALYVNRAGFEDKGEGLLKAMKAMGREEVYQSATGDLFWVKLQPWPNPVLPVRKTNLQPKG